MRIRIRIISALVSVMISVPYVFALSSFSEDVQAMNEAAQSVVLLNLYDRAESLIGTASGFFAFDSMTIVTNYHAVKGAYAVTAFDESDQSFDVPLIHCYDEKKDIAVLHTITPTNCKPLDFANSDLLQRGESVVAIGSPLGFKNVFSTGIISGIDDSAGYRILSFTAPISPGSSGGALFDKSGQVIGITSGSFEEGQSLNIAIASNEISYLMGAAPSNETMKEHYTRTNTPKVATIKPGVLTIVTSADFYPYEYIDDNGKLVGIEIEIIEAVAESLSLDISYKTTPYDEAFLLLGSTADVVVNGITYTPQRAKYALPCYVFKITDEYGDFEPYFYIDPKNEPLRTAMINSIRAIRDDGTIEQILSKYLPKRR